MNTINKSMLTVAFLTFMHLSCTGTVSTGNTNTNNDLCTPPGTTEICGDGIDQDCSGSDLECPLPDDCDADNDGFDSNSTECGGTDCNDLNFNINPSAQEICGNGIDEDCSGSDLACVPIDCDTDNDGYEVASCGGNDCNDNFAVINPGRTEICDNGIDDDCNPATTDTCSAPASVTITPTTLTLTHGNTYTIAGSGFGIKNSAAPLKWDNFEDGASTLNQRVGNGWYTGKNALLGHYPEYSNEHQRGTSAVSVKQDYFTSGQYNCNFGLHNAITSQKYYVSFYRYAILYPSVTKSRNYKLMSFRTGGAGDWFTLDDPDTPDINEFNVLELRHDMYPLTGQGHSYLSDHEGHLESQFNIYTNGYALDQGEWERFEYWGDAGDLETANGNHKRWLNGQYRAGASSQLVRNRDAGLFTNVYFNGYYSREDAPDVACSDGCPANFWVDDAYIDTTQARVETCNVATWATKEASGARCEIQIPQGTWSNTQLTFRANKGGFSTGEPLYLYVVNSGGVANTSGLPVTFN